MKRRLVAELLAVAPPEDLKARLMAAVAGPRGVESRELYRDRESGVATRLVRLGAGARIPAHRHARPEQCLVIEGELELGGRRLATGEFASGCEVPEAYTREGALLLIIGTEDELS